MKKNLLKMGKSLKVDDANDSNEIENATPPAEDT